MNSLLANLAKQGPLGAAMVALFVGASVVGVISITVGYICAAWFLLLTHTFGAPALDFWGGLGVVMVAVPVVALVILTSGGNK